MRPCNRYGFTLMEVLIAVLVMALGVVGGSAMQLTAMRTRHQSALLSRSMQLASSLADQMRANPQQMRQPDAANGYTRLNYDALGEPDPAPPAVLCLGPGERCDSAALALVDLYQLKLQVRDGLPGGRALVCRDQSPWSGGALRWACSGGAGAPLVVKVGWHGKNPDGTPLRDDSGVFQPGVALAVDAGPGPAP
ncbi:type IV pilus modification protein PilV [Rugamonas sp.]|uniref:type IV pilus modification protein PilV n=1 Tax=Rugamonas sp. TaxID=1926287 RepID=UPI0025D6EC8E|nr:type IV pilus modification protein PilV [Rugamonas sp.]